MGSCRRCDGGHPTENCATFDTTEFEVKRPDIEARPSKSYLMGSTILQQPEGSKCVHFALSHGSTLQDGERCQNNDGRPKRIPIKDVRRKISTWMREYSHKIWNGVKFREWIRRSGADDESTYYRNLLRPDRWASLPEIAAFAMDCGLNVEVYELSKGAPRKIHEMPDDPNELSITIRLLRSGTFEYDLLTGGTELTEEDADASTEGWKYPAEDEEKRTEVILGKAHKMMEEVGMPLDEAVTASRWWYDKDLYRHPSSIDVESNSAVMGNFSLCDKG